MAKANPSLISSKIWNWNTSQVGANGWAHEHTWVSGIWESDQRLFIEEGGGWEGITLLNLGGSKSSHEDNLSIPGGLENLTWWELTDIDLLIGVSDVSSSSDHLVVDNGGDGLDSEHVSGDDESLEHIDLSSLDLVIFVLLVVQSILVIPVINLGLGVEGVSEVWWSWGSNPVVWSVSSQEIVCKFPVFSIIIILDNSELSRLSAYFY